MNHDIPIINPMEWTDPEIDKFIKVDFLSLSQYDIQPAKPTIVDAYPINSNKVKENEETSVLEKMVNVKDVYEDDSEIENNYGDMIWASDLPSEDDSKDDDSNF